jgi:hypothetical protein
VSTRGESEWVKNVRANPNVTIGNKSGTTGYVAREIPEQDRQGVLTAYRSKAGRAVEGYFRKLPREADHPVFSLTKTGWRMKAPVRQGFTNGRPPTVLADPGKYDPDRWAASGPLRYGRGVTAWLLRAASFGRGPAKEPAQQVGTSLCHIRGLRAIGDFRRPVPCWRALNEPENLNSFFLKDPQTKNGSFHPTICSPSWSSLSNRGSGISSDPHQTRSARYTELAKASAVASKYGRNEEDIAVLMAEFDPAELDPRLLPYLQIDALERSKALLLRTREWSKGCDAWSTPPPRRAPNREARRSALDRSPAPSRIVCNLPARAPRTRASCGAPNVGRIFVVEPGDQFLLGAVRFDYSTRQADG